MKKYSLLLAISGFVMSISFLQCKKPVTTEEKVKTQIENTISVDTSESKTILSSIESTVIEKSITTTSDKLKPIVVDKSKPATSDTPKPIIVDKPVPITTDNPKLIVVKPLPTTTDKPQATSVDKSTTWVSADFSLKSVKATIEGTSTLHKWVSKITIMEGKGLFQLEDHIPVLIKNAEIKMAVQGIKSEKGDKMDNKTYETFKFDEYPYITYSFSNAVIKINDSNVVSMEATGTLSMAGVSNLDSITAIGKKLPNGDLQLTVSKIIKMTDFSMKPPVMFLGTMKVGNEITVNFDFVLHTINN
jgi:hypothetical protein